MNNAEWIFGWNKNREIPQTLVDQLQEFDLDLIRKLVTEKHDQVNWGDLAGKASPPDAFRVDRQNRISKEDALAAGEKMLAEGKVAMILVAGGQGTRLGFDKPKGLFPIGPVSGRTLFEVFIDQIKALQKHYGVSIPVYVMTSPATHAETVAHFEENNSFGMSPDELTIFCQGTMPAVDQDSGRLLRSSETEFALSPNGHGGMLDALIQSGCLDSATKQGVEYFFYGQIDNPLAQVCDRALLGYHQLAESEMTTQVVTKAHPLEKVGNVVEIDGKVQIIEYSDLPEEYALKTDEDGNPRLWAGNIAVHVFSADFLKRAGNNDSSLPFHLANKQVPYVDEAGEIQSPEKPNAIKFEKFIFDLLPLAKNAIAVEVAKSEGFAPVKNADGAEADTPSLARQAISDLHKSWLRSNGVAVDDDVLVEIHPSFALYPQQLADCDLPATVTESTYFN